jgi:hypothetical protein
LVLPEPDPKLSSQKGNFYNFKFFLFISILEKGKLSNPTNAPGSAEKKAKTKAQSEDDDKVEFLKEEQGPKRVVVKTEPGTYVVNFIFVLIFFRRPRKARKALEASAESESESEKQKVQTRASSKKER